MILVSGCPERCSIGPRGWIAGDLLPDLDPIGLEIIEKALLKISSGFEPVRDEMGTGGIQQSAKAPLSDSSVFLEFGEITTEDGIFHRVTLTLSMHEL